MCAILRILVSSSFFMLIFIVQPSIDITLSPIILTFATLCC